jgi:hypothetical protein
VKLAIAFFPGNRFVPDFHMRAISPDIFFRKRGHNGIGFVTHDSPAAGSFGRRDRRQAQARSQIQNGVSRAHQLAHKINFGGFIFIVPQCFAHTSGDRRFRGFDDHVSHGKLNVPALAPLPDQRYTKSQVAPGGHFAPFVLHED